MAFDADRGRLWVVCRSCERWNLSPIEERWEIVEACERMYRDTRKRVTTENIGLARVRGGLDLVRIGEPQRPEFAAWRYGDQFGRRRRSAVLRTGLGLGAIGAVYLGLAAAGVGVAGFLYFGMNRAKRVVEGDPLEEVGVIPLGDEAYYVKRRELTMFRIIPDGDSWALELPPATSRFADSAERAMLHIQRGWDDKQVITGDAADYAVRMLLPSVNRFGGNRARVTEAVNLLEHTDPARYINYVARAEAQFTGGSITQLPYPVRLALEMATHEDAERRAMEGELAMLEDAWRVAEEIAAISDDLLTPQSVLSRIRSFTRG